MLKDFLSNAMSESSPTSSRRTVLLFYAIILGTVLYVAIIALGYVICLSKIDRTSSIQVLKYMIYFCFGTLVFILLLSGVITWQNINDTIQSVKGLPPGVQQQITQAIDKTTATTTVTTKPTE